MQCDRVVDGMSIQVYQYRYRSHTFTQANMIHFKATLQKNLEKLYRPGESIAFK